jgi:hypothetical protein
MLMLVVAPSVHHNKDRYAHFAELSWGEEQIAIDVILLKSPSLMEFIHPGPHTRDVIVTMDFGLRRIKLPHAIQNFRKSVNQWAAHLSWQPEPHGKR